MGSKQLYFLFIFCTSLVILASLHPHTASAHRMLIEHDEAGFIHVRYDDGTGAGNAFVTAYDENGDVLFERKTDDDGILNYDKEWEIHRVVADDRMGHRAVSTTGEEASLLDSVPLSVRALFGFSILLFIAAFFLLRTNKKSGDGEKSQ
ncbi:hypothetical protein [Virgibacillus kimchii]